MARTSGTLFVPSNCLMTAPGWGEFKLTIDALGYGLSVVATEATTRSSRVFYPFVRTSGLWYVNAIFPYYQQWRSFQNWLLGYLGRATDPHKTVFKPITVQVETEDWTKVGYPTSMLTYGDDWDAAMYTTNVGFASASDPETMSGNASRFYRATEDDAARAFYPAGFQAFDIPRPVPNPYTNNPDDVYDNTQGGGWPGTNIPIPN